MTQFKSIEAHTWPDWTGHTGLGHTLRCGTLLKYKQIQWYQQISCSLLNIQLYSIPLARTQQVINEFCSRRVLAHTTSRSFLLHQSAVLSLVESKGNGLNGCFRLVQITFFIEYSWREEKALKGSVSSTHRVDNLLCPRRLWHSQVAQGKTWKLFWAPPPLAKL